MYGVYNKSEASRPRTAQDKLISGFNACRFALTEPMRLRIARARYERFYQGHDEEPLVSVYIPTYNRGRILVERSVPSVLSQTYRNLELIIIGDHCTDDTADLISKIDDPRIRFYNLPTRKRRYPDDWEIHWLAGPVTAANEALRRVKGRWISRVDDDDSWTPDHVKALLECARIGRYEFVTGRAVGERFGKREIGPAPRAESAYFTGVPDDPNDDSPRIGATSTVFYRSYLRFFRYNINCWRKGWNRVNDADLYMRMYRAGVRFGFLDRVVAFVLPRPGEETVGRAAYELTKDEKQAHFTFGEK